MDFIIFTSIDSPEPPEEFIVCWFQAWPCNVFWPMNFEWKDTCYFLAWFAVFFPFTLRLAMFLVEAAPSAQIQEQETMGQSYSQWRCYMRGYLLYVITSIELLRSLVTVAWLLLNFQLSGWCLSRVWCSTSISLCNCVSPHVIFFSFVGPSIWLL